MDGRFVRILGIRATALAAALACVAASAMQPLVLRAETAVSSHEVRMSDLVAGEGLPEDTVHRLRGQRVATAPLLGQVLTLDHGTLQRLLAHSGFDTSLVGAQTVKVRRAGQRVEAATLCEAVTGALQHALPPLPAQSEFGVRCDDALAAVEVGSGPLILQPIVNAASVLDGRKEVAVELRVAQRMERVVRVPIEVSLQATLWCAGEGVAAGQPVLEQHFVPCRRRVQRMEQLRAAGSALPAGRLKRALRAGEVLAAGDVAETGLQLRGDEVTVLYRAGALAVESRGRLSQEGRIGDAVRVQIGAKESVVGRLASATLVEVEEQP